MSWDESFLGARASRPHNEGFLGARASRPHKAWHSLAHLPHLDQPATAPWLSFGPADAVPADRVAACSISLELSGGQRDRMRAGRPLSQAMPSRRCGGEWKPGRQAREQGSGTIGDVCLSPYRGEPDSSRRNSWVPEGTDSGESPLFITFGTVVTVSSAIADRWTFGGVSRLAAPSLSGERRAGCQADLQPPPAGGWMRGAVRRPEVCGRTSGTGLACRLR